MTIEGGTPVKLNGDLGGSGDVEDDFAISPDSSRVVYRADQDTNGVRELYSAPISGGSFAKLSGSMPSDGDVANFRFSPDSQYVLYTADQETDGLRELYSVSLTGGTPVKLNGSVDGNMYFSSISVSLDSQWVVFVAHYEAVSGHHLYTVPIDGGTPIMLSEERSYPVRVRGDFLITPDSSRVVYRADQETEDDDELYSVPITGGTPTKLNGPINSIAGDVKSGFQLTSDGSRVLYRADLEETAMYDLYSVSVEGGDAIRLNYTPNGHWNVYCFDISPDNQWVVWGCSSHDLYSVPVTGGMPTWLMEASSNGHWEISPDSSRVAWMAEFTLPGWVELFAVSITGGSLFQLNVPLDPLLGNVTGFEFLPDGSGVIYRADQHDTVDELFASLFVPGADLGIQKNVESATSVAAGQPLTYQLTISNTGELAASGVIISDTIPSELTDLSFDYGGIELTQIGSTPYRWQVQDLAPGEGGVITITGILDPALSDGVDIINTATISSETPDDNYGDNEAQVNVRVKSGLQNYLPYLAKDE
ncbi:MAG: hypothetical protein PVG32_15630 [Anaerolineales bacterium]